LVAAPKSVTTIRRSTGAIRVSAYVVAAWLGGIILNLLTYSGYYEIALRDFGEQD